jgi:REP element-mobilizing transposase RayT
MAHSLVKVYVHYVWTTKNRERTLAGDARRLTSEHLGAYALEKGIQVEILNVQPEHVHMLVKVAHDQRVEDLVKLMKGESSHWINQRDIVPGKFSWQTGYAALSVSYDRLDAVRQYITNQDEHHRRKSFTEELRTMLREAGYTEEEIAEMLRI